MGSPVSFDHRQTRAPASRSARHLVRPKRVGDHDENALRFLGCFHALGLASLAPALKPLISVGVRPVPPAGEHGQMSMPELPAPGPMCATQRRRRAAIDSVRAGASRWPSNPRWRRRRQRRGRAGRRSGIRRGRETERGGDAYRAPTGICTIGDGVYFTLYVSSYVGTVIIVGFLCGGVGGIQ